MKSEDIEIKLNPAVLANLEWDQDVPSEFEEPIPPSFNKRSKKSHREDQKMKTRGKGRSGAQKKVRFGGSTEALGGTNDTNGDYSPPPPPGFHRVRVQTYHREGGPPVLPGNVPDFVYSDAGEDYVLTSPPNRSTHWMSGGSSGFPEKFPKQATQSSSSQRKNRQRMVVEDSEDEGESVEAIESDVHRSGQSSRAPTDRQRRLLKRSPKSKRTVETKPQSRRTFMDSGKPMSKPKGSRSESKTKADDLNDFIASDSDFISESSLNSTSSIVDTCESTDIESSSDGGATCDDRSSNSILVRTSTRRGSPQSKCGTKRKRSISKVNLTHELDELFIEMKTWTRPQKNPRRSGRRTQELQRNYQPGKSIATQNARSLSKVPQDESCTLDDEPDWRCDVPRDSIELSDRGYRYHMRMRTEK
ncbi:hypothetical protein BCR34DRAFT_597524 [Clohesyomyces aquaticus]|uniref:Uncharacterized protein n=1 Tax=Clohesyomyces aquaticus TaxID=1231657 RepID=A0A1Y2A2S9_9PLEO|nr:hypothetical protein BCR34DRAFT_597524 [Clohesyomyces aquaticus]